MKNRKTGGMNKHFVGVWFLVLVMISFNGIAHAYTADVSCFFEGLVLDTGEKAQDQTVLVMIFGQPDKIEQVLQPTETPLADFFPAPEVDLFFEYQPALNNAIILMPEHLMQIAVVETGFDFTDIDKIVFDEFDRGQQLTLNSNVLLLVKTTADDMWKLNLAYQGNLDVRVNVESLNPNQPAVPEPTTLMLLGIGGVMVAALTRLKKRGRMAIKMVLMLGVALSCFNSVLVVSAQDLPDTLVTIKKEGMGMVIAGSQRCEADCQEMRVAYTQNAAMILKAIPDAGSWFVGWRKADGSLSTGKVYVQPGDTVTAVFEKQLDSITVFDYDYWREMFSLPTTKLQSIKIKKTFSTDEKVYQFSEGQEIYGLAINSAIRLQHDASLVRVILVDDQAHEYLVYEAYPLISLNPSFSIKNSCEETWFVKAVKPVALKVQVIDASVTIYELLVDETPKQISSDTARLITQQINDAQTSFKIKALNAHIQQKGLKWVAGETSVSQLSYEEKNGLFSGDYLPNLQGFEYYKGGIFEIRSGNNPSPSLTGDSTSLVESFDWRSRHGENWITPVKDQQQCGSCWAFAATGATEALVNLYFNQHLDLDLAEQDALSCSGGGNCSNGGWPGVALDYYTTTGVVDEGCFLYSASDKTCSNKCTNPTERIKINGKIDFGSAGYPATEDTLKKMIIEYGPVSGAIRSWRHAMTLVGYQKDSGDGQTIWIFKNSWGTMWGEYGYAKLKLAMSDIRDTFALRSPINSATPRQISCVDKDNDGYCNWGISANKPSSCPYFCQPKKDCDDSNPNLAPFDANYICSPVPTPTPIVLTEGTDPTWSPDSQRLAFRKGENSIWTIAANGTDAKQIVVMPSPRGAWGPVYQSKSNRIYYLDNSPSGADFWWISWTSYDGSAGRNTVKMVPGGEGFTPPRFSEDGRQFCYVHNGYNEQGVRYGRYDLILANADGSNAHSILRDDAIVDGVAWGRGGNRNRLLYVKSVENVRSLFTISMDGSGETRITGVDVGDCSNPKWSPDGQYLVFTKIDPATNIRQIYAISSQGTNLRQLTTSAGDKETPEVSPDGTKVAYVTKQDGRNVIVILPNLMPPTPTYLTQVEAARYGTGWPSCASQDAEKISTQYIPFPQEITLDRSIDGSCWETPQATSYRKAGSSTWIPFTAHTILNAEVGDYEFRAYAKSPGGWGSCGLLCSVKMTLTYAGQITKVYDAARYGTGWPSCASQDAEKISTQRIPFPQNIILDRSIDGSCWETPQATSYRKAGSSTWIPFTARTTVSAEAGDYEFRVYAKSPGGWGSCGLLCSVKMTLTYSE